MMTKVLDRFTRKRLTVYCGFLVLLVFSWLLSSFLACYAATRRPHQPFAEPPPEVSWTKFESVRLHTVDGEDLGAWFSAGSDDCPSVLLLHGKGGSRRHSLPLAQLFSSQGCGVLAISERAHGDSSGDFNDMGYSARHDVVAAVRYLEKRRPGRPIIVQGMSQGAAAAIYAAEELGTRVSGYILECPYRDMRTAARDRTTLYLPPILNEVGYAGLSLTAPYFLRHIDDMSPLEHITDIPASVPILLLAGSRDEHACPAEVREIHERVRSHSRFVVFEGAGHEVFCCSNPEEYCQAVTQLLASAAHHP